MKIVSSVVTMIMVTLSLSLLSSSLAFQPQVRSIRYNHGFSLSVPSLSSSSIMQPMQSSKVILSSTPTAASETSDAKEDPLFEGIGKGIMRDFKGRLPLYKSDIKDGLNVQCLAATCFLFFACLAPAVGFGGLFDVATNGAIGTMEMVSSTAACGFIYALTSAQPLTIIGSTGPVLAFVACLAQLAKIMNVPFLPLYAWTGLWTSAILFISSLTSASNLVKYLTRFTDEIFSTLISAIFVVEAVSDVAGSFAGPFPKALMTLLCATSTFTIATILKGLRKSTFFTKKIRTALSNFAPTIGVVTAALLARWARLARGVALPALKIPETFVTTSGRPWLVPIFDLPVWARWAAFVPAIMATVLLFLDQNITVRLVNNPRWKMTKDRGQRVKGTTGVLDGTHADLFVISILTALQSLIGIPWLVAATVRSLSHVGALTIYDEKDNTKAVGSIEQRVTGSAIHALIGMCVFFQKPRKLLSQIPLPVLMGLFMYLGTSALPGNEMWERIVAMFKSDDGGGDAQFRWDKLGVPKKVTNLFTFIQVACLGAMFYVKESPLGVLFPVVIAMLAPLRFALEKTNTIKKEYIEILDED